MKLYLIVALLLTIAWPALESTQRQKKAKAPCEPTLAKCPDEGCGKDFDPNLNQRKNIRSDDQKATIRTLTWMKKLDNPENFTKGDSREELTALGEGQKITVVAYLLTVKQEGAESCNCGLTAKKDTDNHLVLVSKSTLDEFPIPDDADDADSEAVFHSREPQSQTAEFTPRVRLTHPNFTHEKVESLIDSTPQEALLVRVTGLLMFDSEHFIRNPLVRVNNWEIHPILKLEFCESGDNCRAASDAGWKSIDDLQ
jgi:hypothetical protein